MAPVQTTASPCESRSPNPLPWEVSPNFPLKLPQAVVSPGLASDHWRTPALHTGHLSARFDPCSPHQRHLELLVARGLP